MKLFDTHCHFDFEVFDSQRSSHVEQASIAGVQRILIPSVGPENWQKVSGLSLASFTQASLTGEQSHPLSIYYALGCHPCFLNSFNEDVQAKLIAQLDNRHSGCVAIGECGLDWVTNENKILQERALVWQLDVAKQYQLPVILHNRQAHNRLIQLVKAAKLPKGGVIHAFSGSYEQGMEWIRLGFYLGIGGTLTYPRAKKTRQAVSTLPLEKMVLETDAPDMPIFGFQGKLNTPSQLSFTLDALALLRNQTKQTIASQIWKNSNSLLSICE